MATIAVHAQSLSVPNPGDLLSADLICDAVAVAILHRLDIDWSALIKGVEKLSHYNRDRLGTALNEADYPTVAQRRHFARALSANLATAKRMTAGPRSEHDGT